jgi:ribonuclease HI
MNTENWEIKLCWVKTHAGIMGNQIAYTLARKTTKIKSLTEEYNRIPKSV